MKSVKSDLKTNDFLVKLHKLFDKHKINGKGLNMGGELHNYRLSPASDSYDLEGLMSPRVPIFP